MRSDRKNCPFCYEDIHVRALKCKHCGSMLDGNVPLPGVARGAGTTPAPPPGATPAPGGTPQWWNLSGPLEPETRIREYRIERMLGEGGMGEVYLAEDVETGRRVAMKVVAPELMRDEGVRKRFREEARVMAGLSQPNIVTLYSFFEEGNRFFLVMEYIDGESLEDRIERGYLELEEARRISNGVLAALDFAHSAAQPVIHRDIKPANILLGKDGRVVVTDFGVAKALGREKLTRTRGVVGTMEYMSPEQVKGSDVTRAADLYCFGITLFKMLTGVVPFPQESDTGLECMNAHVGGTPPRLSEFRDGVPKAVQDVLSLALAKAPQERPDGAGKMRTLLDSAFLRSGAPAPAPAPATTPRETSASTAVPSRPDKATPEASAESESARKTPSKKTKSGSFTRRERKVVVIVCLVGTLFGLIGGLGSSGSPVGMVFGGLIGFTMGLGLASVVVIVATLCVRIATFFVWLWRRQDD